MARHSATAGVAVSEASMNRHENKMIGEYQSRLPSPPTPTLQNPRLAFKLLAG
jgi:hypothetical protein